MTITPAEVLLRLVFAVTGQAIGRRDGHPVWGAFAGVLFAPIGVIVVAPVTWRSLACKRSDPFRRVLFT